MTIARPLLACAAPLLLMLAGCQPSGTDNAGAPRGNLEGAKIGADFILTDQDGKPVRWADFNGRYRLVYFGYTFCPDVCPVDLQNIMAGYRLLEKAAPAKAAKLAPIFITVDPQRDTPAVIKTYVSAFHPRLIGLTGTAEQIDKVKHDFAVVSAREASETAKDYLVSHSRTPYLFGPDGKPIALVPVDQPGTPDGDGKPQAVADMLAQWIK